MKRVLRPVPIAAIAATIALLALLAYAVAQNGPDSSIDSAVAAGRRPAAPSLDLPRLNGGGKLSLKSLRGKVVVINYWASWCPPCRDEAPLLERWQHRIEGRNATILGVDVLDVAADAQAFVHRFGITYPVVRDASGASRGPFGVGGQPESFVIDRRGRIVDVRRLPVTDAYLRRVLPPVLREPA